MRSFLVLLGVLSLSSAGTWARAASEGAVENQVFAGYGFGISKQVDGESVLQVQAARLHSVFPSLGRFQLGYGVRASLLSADQLVGKKYGVSALNAVFHAAYQGLEWVDVGMNLDVMGASFGNDVSHRLNLLRGGSADLGFLNSEFYVTARVSDAARVRLSFMHVASGASPQAFVDFVGLSVGWVW